jgi:hypothetical protein
MPPTLDTRKMKKTTVCTVCRRSRLVWSRARISSIDAPVVPTIEARRAPTARKPEFTAGVATRSPRRSTPPEITKSPASSTMNDA